MQVLVSKAAASTSSTPTKSKVSKCETYYIATAVRILP